MPILKISDDSGFLAVVVPGAYASFVSEDWELKQLFEHFHQAMAKRNLLIWGTGLEGFWKCDVRLEKSAAKGFREISGPIRVTGGEVLITNYESLTMAAQFSDEKLPQKHERHRVVKLKDGDYRCRVVQV